MKGKICALIKIRNRWCGTYENPGDQKTRNKGIFIKHQWYRDQYKQRNYYLKLISDLTGVELWLKDFKVL